MCELFTFASIDTDVRFSHVCQRCLIYLGASTSASLVFGQQGSFSSSLANNGGISEQSLNRPSDIRESPNGLGVYISDTLNHR